MDRRNRFVVIVDDDASISGRTTVKVLPLQPDEVGHPSITLQ
jgi:hypothetical protein